MAIGSRGVLRTIGSSGREKPKAIGSRGVLRAIGSRGHARQSRAGGRGTWGNPEQGDCTEGSRKQGCTEGHGEQGSTKSNREQGVYLSQSGAKGGLLGQSGER